MTTPTITPCLGYKDGHAAIGFLEPAFGFEVNIKADDDDGRLLHSEMVYGDGVISRGTQRYRCTDLGGQEWTFGASAPSTEPPSWG